MRGGLNRYPTYAQGLGAAYAIAACIAFAEGTLRLVRLSTPLSPLPGTALEYRTVPAGIGLACSLPPAHLTNIPSFVLLQATDYDKDAPKNETGFRRWKDQKSDDDKPQFRVVHGGSKTELASVHGGRALHRRKRVPRLFEMRREERAERGDPRWVRSAVSMGVLTKAQARQIDRDASREEQPDDSGPALAPLGDLTHHEQRVEDLDAFRQMFEG